MDSLFVGKEKFWVALAVSATSILNLESVITPPMIDMAVNAVIIPLVVYLTANTVAEEK